MKKLLVILTVLLALTSCKIANKVSGDILPEHIDFWNGGTNIFSADDVYVEMQRVSQAYPLGANAYFYLYSVRKHKDEKPIITIMDSESLAPAWTE